VRKPKRKAPQPRTKPPRNITPTSEEWALAVEMAADDGVSVSQLFGILIRAESRRRERRIS
jgi:hypothetical protein